MQPAYVLVLTLLALGYLARKLGRFPDSASEVLNRFVIDLCVPAVLLRLLPTLSFERELIALVAAPWLAAALAFLIARTAARVLKLDSASEAVLFLCTALGNTSFLGYPLCIALLGQGSLKYAVVYDQLGSFLLLAIVAPVVVARAAGGGSPSAGETIKRVLTFPPFIALLLALMPIPRPDFVEPVLEQISAALVPVAIFAVGLKMRITPPRELSAFILGLVVKLGVLPAVAFGIAYAFQAPPDVFEVVVLEAAMPAMVTAGALAMAAGIAPELAAALVGWGVIAALITVPAWAAFVR